MDSLKHSAIMNAFNIGSVIQSVHEWVDRHLQLVLRTSLALIIVLASAFLARRPSEMTLLAIVGAAGVFIIMRWPMLGLAGVIIGGLAVPFGLGTGSESELNPPILLLVLLMGISVLEVIRRRGVERIHSRVVLPLIAFLGAALLSFFVGQLPWFYTSSAPVRAQLGGLGIFLLSVVALLLTAKMVKDLRWLKRLTWIFLILGAFYVIGQLAPPLWGVVGKLYKPSAVGSLFWLWLVALAFSQAIFNPLLDSRWRAVLLGLVGLTLFVAMTRNVGWTSGWAPAVVAIAVILVIGAPRVGIPVMILGGVVMLLRSQLISNLLNAGDNAYSEMTRLQAWGILFQIIKVSPVFGLGPANYYSYTPLFSILGYHVRFNSHNNYVDLLAQTGILGTACYLWFFYAIGRVGLELRTRVPTGFARAYVYGALGGIAGMLVAGMLGDWVLPFVYNIGFAGFRASVLGWLFLGGLVAIEQMVRTGGQLEDALPKT
jgi:O-antigen ligase